MKRGWRESVSIFLRGWLGSILVAVILATSFKSAIADWNEVPTGSMKPTIVEGDRIFVNKLAYDLKIPYTRFHLSVWGDPQRGDIVVFHSPADGTRLVKRVVGVPGDVIALSNNRLFVNGQAAVYEAQPFPDAPQESGAAAPLLFTEAVDGREHPVLIYPRRPSLRTFGPITVPEGHYFMMGDNRDNSADSRYFGFVARKLIVGRTSSVVISLDIHDHFRPRWERFFSRLD